MTLRQDALFRAALTRLPLALQEDLAHSRLDKAGILQHFTKVTAEVLNFPGKIASHLTHTTAPVSLLPLPSSVLPRLLLPFAVPQTIDEHVVNHTDSKDGLTASEELHIGSVQAPELLSVSHTSQFSLFFHHVATLAEVKNFRFPVDVEITTDFLDMDSSAKGGLSVDARIPLTSEPENIVTDELSTDELPMVRPTLPKLTVDVPNEMAEILSLKSGSLAGRIVTKIIAKSGQTDIPMEAVAPNKVFSLPLFPEVPEASPCYPKAADGSPQVQNIETIPFPVLSKAEKLQLKRPVAKSRCLRAVPKRLKGFLIVNFWMTHADVNGLMPESKVVSILDQVRLLQLVRQLLCR